MEIENELKTHTLYIKPTYSVIMPTPSRRKGPLSEFQRENLKNLKREKHTGKLSRKSSQRLMNAINWLVSSAEEKRVFSKETNTHHMFKLNFITLTLPTLEHGISDNFFKKTILHNFINVCRYRYNLKNYVWKVEAQKNGNIHVHFTTDTFIPHQALRKVWNKILSNHGILQHYTAKHLNMSLKDYIDEYRYSQKNVSIDILKKRYKKGVASSWLQPNTTDVKAVYKVKDVAAYLAQYMAKKETDRRKINGRLWGASHLLSYANKLSVIIPVDAAYKILDSLQSEHVKSSPITVFDKLTKLPRSIGEVFFYSLDHWKNHFSGKLKEIFNEMCFFIRTNIDIDAWENKLKDLKETYVYSEKLRVPKKEYIQSSIHI